MKSEGIRGERRALVAAARGGRRARIRCAVCRAAPNAAR